MLQIPNRLGLRLLYKNMISLTTMVVDEIRTIDSGTIFSGVFNPGTLGVGIIVGTANESCHYLLSPLLGDLDLVQRRRDGIVRSTLSLILSPSSCCCCCCCRYDYRRREARRAPGDVNVLCLIKLPLVIGPGRRRRVVQIAGAGAAIIRHLPSTLLHSKQKYSNKQEIQNERARVARKQQSRCLFPSFKPFRPPQWITKAQKKPLKPLKNQEPRKISMERERAVRKAYKPNEEENIK
jgi:hypothetical protein